MRRPRTPEGSTRRHAPAHEPFSARVHLAWRGTPLDTISLRPGGRLSTSLRSGARLDARFDDDEALTLAVRIDGGPWLSLEPGVPALDPSGHTVAFEIDVREEAEPRPLAVDSHLLHATMIAGAIMVCAVSALRMTPTELPDRSPGGGLPAAELRRLIRVTSGAAPERGPALFVAQGRAPDEAERITDPVPAAGAPSRAVSRRTREPSVADTLDAIVKALNNGASGVDLRLTVGDLAQSTARSEQLGAGLGGMLAPRRLLDDGAGSALVDAGSSRLSDLLRRSAQRREDEAEARLRRAPRLVGPVSRADVPSGDVTFDGLDPVVRDHIARAVRSRKKSVRYCYESWGLASDPQRQGRLVLEMTLLPDGHLTDIEVRANDRSLRLVAECVEQQVGEWYLGDGLVDEPQRLSFPFLLQPKQSP